jgi:stage II sporulation protein D
MLKYKVVFCVIFCSAVALSQQELKISLFHNLATKQVQVNEDMGSYLLLSDLGIVDTLPKAFTLKILKVANKVSGNLDGIELGEFKWLKLERLDEESGFRIKSLTHNTKERRYWSDVHFSSDGKKILILNYVEQAKYLEGVVESESGGGQGIEYYKIQATISRTYALSHIDRHQSEGFNLCDLVHCQVYHNRSLRNEFIPQAVKETKNMVLVDANIRLITAAFHANCGGQTANSEDVWTKELSYLRSVKDPFCTDRVQATWTKTIDKEKFVAYVKTKNASALKHHSTQEMNFYYSQNNRKIYYSGEGYRIPLKKMREDFELRSTYFSVSEVDEKIILNGRGFGHGVGLCQEGAMKMAELGYSFLEILRFYYTDVHLIDLQFINFYRSE